MSNDDKNRVSSIVAKAIDASTFSQLQAFTKDLESRPVERLLRDVADLVAPSESKAQIVSYVIATKYRHADADQRAKILESLDRTMKSMEPGERRERVDAIVQRIREA